MQMEVALHPASRASIRRPLLCWVPWVCARGCMWSSHKHLCHLCVCRELPDARPISALILLNQSQGSLIRALRVASWVSQAGHPRSSCGCQLPLWRRVRPGGRLLKAGDRALGSEGLK